MYGLYTTPRGTDKCHPHLCICDRVGQPYPHSGGFDKALGIYLRTKILLSKLS